MTVATEPGVRRPPAAALEPERGFGSTSWVIGAIVVLAGVLRFATLNQGVWIDEAVTVHEVSGSLAHTVSTVVHHELSPPIYFICLWVWRMLFGPSLVAMRAMSAFFGVATIPVAYMVAVRVAGRRAALIVAVIAASSPVMLYYSQELRPYALLVFLCSAGLLAFVALRQGYDHRMLILWCTASVLALATHYFAALAVAPQAALLLTRARHDRRKLLGTGIAAAVIGIEAIALAMLLHFQHARAYQYGLELIRSPFVPEQFNAHVAATSNGTKLGEELFLGPGGPDKSLATNLMLAFVLLALWMLARAGREGRRVKLMLLLLAPAIAAAILFQAADLPYQGRYLLVVWLPLTIVVGTGLGLLPRAVRAAAVAILCALSLLIGLVTALVPRYSGREDVQAAAQSLGAASSGRLIAISQQWDLYPLHLYRPASRSVNTATVRVRELDVLTMPQRDFPADSDANRPPVPTVSGLPASMKLSRTILGPTFVLQRYRSPVPVTLSVDPQTGSPFSAQFRFLYEPAGGRLGAP